MHARRNAISCKTMKYTAGQAAKAVGVSTATITRALKNGRISGIKGDNGTWSIDPAELHRVFPRVTTDTVTRNPKLDTSIPPDETPQLRAKIEALEALLERERAALEETRTDRDAWRQQATALLGAPPKKRQFWPW